MRWPIIAAGAALIAAITASAAYDGWRLHEQVMSASERELGNLSNALAEQAARNLQAVDVLLRDTASWYETSGRASGPAAVRQSLASRVVGVSQVSVLTIIDAEGMQRYRSRETGEPLASVADRPYFTVQRQTPDAGMYINEPVVTRSERQASLVVSRRLSGPGGEFDGVVSATVTLQQLQQMYSAIHLGEGSALLLTTQNGQLIVRQPPADGVETQRFPDLVALKGGNLVDHSVSPIDGRLKLIAVVGVGSRPLMLAITRDQQEALEPWYDEMQSAAVRTAVLSLLVVLTIAVILRQLRRLERGEQALRQSEQRYAMALDAADEGHGEWNVKSGAVFASERWRLLHRVDDGQVDTAAAVKRAVPIHPDDRAAVRAAIAEHLAGRSPAIEIEYRVRSGAGDDDDETAWRWIHARGRCVFDAQGTAQQLFCAASDITARKSAEAERGRLEARLQQTERLEALGTLAGGIAHDFNNVLGAILGFGEMAQLQTEAASPVRRNIEQVLQAGARARLLVRQILDFSRRGVAEQAPVHVQAVIDEVVTMLAPTLPAGLPLQTRLEAGNAAVLGDATQLYQVVMNLCTNAVYAIGERGLLEIAARRADVAEGRSLLQGDLQAGAYVCIEVADSGSGIPPDVKARMFDPFYTTRRGAGGTGLGLSVVHGIVGDMGGAIDVADREGGGTSITIWLPVAGDADPPLPAIDADWPQGAGQTVMVVDDEAALIELAEEVLAGLGYEPVGYASCEAALAAFEADPDRFDAVLSDVTLPGMHGDELAERLHGLRPQLPVILVSGNIGAATLERARAANVASVLHKPLALRELAECLGAIFAARRPLNALPFGCS
jgi:signal transduction histidine kinase/ActR/RegA family two-component response regulator